MDIDSILLILGIILFCLWFFGASELVADILLEKFFDVNPNRPKQLYNNTSIAGVVVGFIPVIIYCLIYQRENLIEYLLSFF